MLTLPVFDPTAFFRVLTFVQVKISACGVCGTVCDAQNPSLVGVGVEVLIAHQDLHYHKGEFLAKVQSQSKQSLGLHLHILPVSINSRYPFPCHHHNSRLTTAGHEATGTIVALGKNVTNVTLGDRVAADALEPCLTCFHCMRRKPQLCSNITGYGGNVPGGMAEYCRYPSRMVFPINELPDLEAVLLEPAACAAHGIERMALEVGSRVLLFGCGPTGILLAQLIRMNGAAHVRALDGILFSRKKWLTGPVDDCVESGPET